MGEIVAIIVTTLTAVLQPTDSGWSSRYHDQPMAATAAYHQIDLAQYDGGIAALSCDCIGEVWLIRPSDTERWYKSIVVDCAGSEETYLWMAENNIIAEVSNKLAGKMRLVPGGRIEVMRP